jgi:hypothetical protein
MIPVSTSDPERQIARALNTSVQEPPSVSKDGIVSSGAFGWVTERAGVLPPYGTRERERMLREIYRMDEMAVIRGAFSGLAKGVASLGWEITGDDTPDPLFQDMASAQGWRLKRSTGIEYYQELFRRANFGAGWGPLMLQLFNDFLRYDGGGYVEVIAPGSAFDRPLGPATGIAHLDPLRCVPTGDPLYPAVYYSRLGGLHVMHRARVIRMVDMEDGDEMHPGYGDSALSRSVSIAMREVYTTRYINARLDDKPPPGFSAIGGMVKSEWEKLQRQYEAQRATDGGTTHGQHQFYFSSDLDKMIKVETHYFQSSPEKFDWIKYLNANVDILALALGVDRQELMQLSGGNIGSAQQSEILDQKGSGKTLGYFLQETERKFNDILPDGFTFGFKPRDNQEATEEANKAKVWVEVAKNAPLSDAEKRTLLANQVGAIQDAIASTPRANDVTNQPLVAGDAAAGADPVAPAETTGLPAAPDTSAADLASAAPADATPTARKDYGTTEIQFVNELARIITSAATPNPYIRLDRRGFGVAVRSLLKQYGTQAYRDGMMAGGVSVDLLDPEDSAEVARVFVEQASYINGLAEAVYADKALTPATALSRASMWGKSLQEFLNAGLMSANRNGMYRWDINPLLENCPDCKRLNGQVHRLKTWIARGLTPRCSKLRCKGFRCGCGFTKTSEKARGRF